MNNKLKKIDDKKKKIYKPFELRTMKFFNETAKYAEEKLGVVWADWNEYMTDTPDLYPTLIIKGSCPLPEHGNSRSIFWLINDNRWFKPGFNMFSCRGKCKKAMDMSIYDLIQRIEECSYGLAIERFADFCGVEAVSHVGI
ncbi:Uncharacterized protein dnl_51310 [Desulfonema limicola]|uniref:Uncharacterized protein n=1 Tax=Desulfonema limicola TaxID=45656 RepID=A0A975BCM6_9BACT|nr:hypothetical protein [Desulfonema limicola]QTA82749.1 Uncharacterized protein dnl_51310 [Desulfonema limicola]